MSFRDTSPRALRLGALLVVELAERFAYFGVLSLLPLHLTGIATTGVRDSVTGLPELWRGLEGVFGRLTPSSFASLVFGLYTGFAYVAPLIGAAVADAGLGRGRMVVAGLALSLAACLLLTTPSALLVALALSAIGGGGVKANLMAQFSAASRSTDAGRRSAFSAYLIAVNVGALCGPLICGWTAQTWGWRAGVAPAALAMGVALVAYLALAPKIAVEDREPEHTGAAFPPTRWLIPVLGSLVPYVLFYAAYNQAFDILPIWAADHVNLSLYGFRAPVSWFYTVDGVFTIAATAIFARLYGNQGRWRIRPAAAFAAGLTLCAVAYLLLAGFSAAALHPTPLLAPVLFFGLIDAGIPFVETTTLGLIARVAPARLGGTAMALTSLAFAIANLSTGALGVLYARLSPVQFWLLHAGVGVVGAGVAVAIGAHLARAFRWTPATLSL